MPTRRDHLGAAAQSAMAAGDWEAARSAFESLAADDPTAEVLAGLGDVLWWLGETVSSVDHLERAFAAYQQLGNPADAVTVGIGLYLTYRVSLGNTAAAHGWLARIARVVEAADRPPLTGWVELLQAHDSADPVVTARLAARARDLATRFGDADLELCALSELRAALVAQGRPDEGTTFMDEAMAAAPWLGSRPGRTPSST